MRNGKYGLKERERALTAIDLEREEQIKTWGHQKHSNEIWLSILVEEVGELATALNDKHDDYVNIEEELVQISAVCVAYLEDIWRNKVEG